ncbi:nitroreductase family protein [bacterium]|nr:nitroreductase family protein [bacterium]
MDFENTVRKRRSIRKFTDQIFPEEQLMKAFELAVLAPNSSNIQTWDFHWVKSPEKKAKLVEACLSQSAARTASHLIVATADSSNWKRSQNPLIQWVRSVSAPKQVIAYYEKVVPFSYRSGFFNLLAPFKWIIFNSVGLFRPMMRKPVTARDIQEVAIKSCALACENFVLSITSLGGATCMMEGFDEVRVKRLLKLGRSSRVVMVIAVGYEGERGTWGPQFRLPLNEVVHQH